MNDDVRDLVALTETLTHEARREGLEAGIEIGRNQRQRTSVRWFEWLFGFVIASAAATIAVVLGEYLGAWT